MKGGKRLFSGEVTESVSGSAAGPTESLLLPGPRKIIAVMKASCLRVDM